MTLESLLQRATAAGYEAEIVEFETDGGVRRRLAFGKPAADDEPTPRVSVPEEMVPLVRDSHFDQFQSLDDFEAIWSPTTGVIECGLDAGNAAFGPAFYVLELLTRRLGSEEERTSSDADRDVTIEVPSPRDDILIRIQNASVEYVILRQLFGRRSSLRPERLPRFPVIRIEGFYPASGEVAGDFLERVGNSVLFQLDLKTNLPLFLSRPAYPPLSPRGRREQPQGIIRAPEFEYDNDAMALYWYGRTAFQMPLLQFLAFYQVVEFYFPRFSELKGLSGNY